MKRTRILGRVQAVVSIGAAVACTSAPPPRELNDAHAAYTRAASGDAADLSPAALYEARRALDAAEAAYAKGANAYLTRDKAYVAIRKAELAEVLASMERARQNQARANVQANDARVRSGEAQGGTEGANESTGEQTADRETRREAEAKAREALAKLSRVTSVGVKDEPRGTVITVPSRTLFANGKSDLLPSAEEELAPLAEALSHATDHDIVVEGHTDSEGSDRLNKELSQRRAETVREALVDHGVPSERITATGVGDSRPVAGNGTTEGLGSNRRIEIVVGPVKRPAAPPR